MGENIQMQLVSAVSGIHTLHRAANIHQGLPSCPSIVQRPTLRGCTGIILQSAASAGDHPCVDFNFIIIIRGLSGLHCSVAALYV